MTDGGHVPNEGLPEHLLAGSDPLGGPEGVATVAPVQGIAPVQGVAMDGGLIPNPAAPGNGLPGAAPQGIGMVPSQGLAGQPQPFGAPGYGVPAGGASLPGVPGEGWGTDPGAPRPAFHFLDQPDQPDPLDDEDDVLLMPGPQGSWGEPLAAGPGEQGVDQQGAPGTPVEPSWPPLEPPLVGVADPAVQQLQPQQVPLHGQALQAPLAPQGQQGQQQGQPPQGQPQGQESLMAAQQPRRPLHAGPPIPDPSLMTGHVPVRSLADRGPSQGATPAHGIPVVVGQPEPQAAAPVQAQPVQQPQGVQPVQEAPQAPQAVEALPVAQAVDVQAQAEAVPAAESPVAVPAADITAQAGAEPAAAPVAVQTVEPIAEQAEPVGADAQPSAAEQPTEVQAPAADPSVAGLPAVEQTAPQPGGDEQPADEQAAAQPAQQPAAQTGQPRRISAFLAAPTPHGLPQVEGTEPVTAVAEAHVEQSVPITAAEQAQAPAAEPVQESAPEQPADEATQPAQATDAGEQAQVVAEVQDPAEAEARTEGFVEVAAETAAGTGEMPSGQAVAVAAAEQPQEALAETEAAAVEAAAVVEAAASEAVEGAGAGGEVPAAAELAVDASDAPEAPAEQPAAEADARSEEGGPSTAGAVTPEAVTAEATDAVDPAAVEAVESATEEPTAEEPTTDEPTAEEPEAEPAEPRGPAAPGYEDAGREAVHQVIRERRDIRNGFRPDPIPHEVLIRVLEAAHTAPSVGYSQPWDFVVIRSAKTRRKMHELAERQREAYADSLPKGRAKQFKEIKIEAILETPVNIVVTADRTRGGRHTLGRHTQPQMAPYSAALAVENLWLAARAEGLGVGWVSFFDEDEMVRELGLPEHLEVVAYLCVGYVDAFPDEPELQQQGWAKKRPLSWVVHEEQYGNRALPGEEPHSLLAETLRGIRPLDAKALGEAWDRQKRMTKPAGSLGMLEIISAQLSGLSRKCPPPIPEPACVAIFAGDHGVHAQGVSPWPQEVTAQMVGNFLAGGAVVNAFAKQIGTEVCVVDVGVAAELPDAIQQGRTTGLLPRKVRPGTGDMTQGPAMTREEALKAVEIGIETARDLVAAGNKALVTGDMGIANTTASAALISVFTGLDPAEVTGRGTGIDDATHARKVEVIRAALTLHQPDPADPIGVLAAVGGLEHAAIAGFLLGAASLRTPVILDGVIAGSAALAAKAIAPEVLAACIAGHRSAEPGHQAALAKLGLRPLIDLDLRLGEGTGALLALPLVQSAARAMHDVATFDSAGVTEKA
ncbi:nicotinate-nucleotide--dimethylbenzimidazole phosphoribosyltransferase [Kitasatospora sp. NPDC050463]|uniref:nicotinate-nucleotide--dimethylbenzimidazole phosphoribosyltransferase n=1 Tax=Kitasatospora sp. NPDC050463 TaxID=3155786 RepID=UPI0034012C61